MLGDLVYYNWFSNFSTSDNRSTGPEYAVVENDDDECMGPHSCHTLPLQRCPNHMGNQCMGPHPADHCEPYASTTLVLPPNMRGCMGRAPPCNSSSSDNSGSHSSHSMGRRCTRPHAGADNAAYSGSGGSGHQNGEQGMCLFVGLFVCLHVWTMLQQIWILMGPGSSKLVWHKICPTK